MVRFIYTVNSNDGIKAYTHQKVRNIAFMIC